MFRVPLRFRVQRKSENIFTGNRCTQRNNTKNKHKQTYRPFVHTVSIRIIDPESHTQKKTPPDCIFILRRILAFYEGLKAKVFLGPNIRKGRCTQDTTGDNILFFCIGSTISACLTHVISSLLGVLFAQANIPTHCYYYYCSYNLDVSKRMNELLIPAITIEISLMRSTNVTGQCHSYDVISHSIGHAAVLIWSLSNEA